MSVQRHRPTRRLCPRHALGWGASWVVVASVAAGCRGGAHRAASGERDAGGAVAASEGAADAHAARTAAEAGAPPDDAIVPSPGDELAGRGRHLLEAIAQDDASLASDIVFPRDAWIATRDSDDAGKDWEKHVAGPFRRALHALSRRAAGFDRAQAVAIEVGRVLVQATPRRHGWKEPLWTASGSRLTFVVDGHAHALPIREMVAWRGAWYVTRLR